MINQIREFFLTGISQLLIALSSLIMVKTVSYELNVSELSYFVTCLTFITIFTQILFGPIANGVSRFAKEIIKYQVINYRLFSKSLMFINVLSSIIFFLLWSFSGQPTQFFLILMIVVVAAIVFGLNLLIFSLLNYFNEKSFIFMSYIAYSLVVIAGLYCLHTLNIHQISLYLSILLVANLVLYNLNFLYIAVNRIRFNMLVLDRSILKKKYWAHTIYQFSKEMIFLGPINWIYFSLIPIVSNFKGEYYLVGFYYVFLQFFYQPVTMIANVVLQYMSPKTFSLKSTSKAVSSIRITYIIFLSLFGSFLVVLELLYPRYYTLILSPKFFSVKEYAILFAISAGLFNLGQIYSNYFLYLKFSRTIKWIVIIRTSFVVVFFLANFNNITLNIILFTIFAGSLIHLMLNIFAIYFLDLPNLKFASKIKSFWL